MTRRIETSCVIVGGGPAGLMIALLLARAGIDVVVLEKHADFLRDFRGDTIHPSTQEVLHELGLFEEFLAQPHADATQISIRWHGVEGVIADFTHLPALRKAISFMPQWDFLDLLATAGGREGGYRLIREAEVDGLFDDGGRIAGVHAKTADGDIEVYARLVIAADGRNSRTRELAGLSPRGRAAAMDVLWFRLPRAEEVYPFVHAGAGMIITIDRGDFWQIAHVIPAGSWNGSASDMELLRQRIGRLSPRMATIMTSLTLSDVHLLRVQLTRLRRWYRDGLLCIGDAAHAMSPAGGVGINLAIQDAVAAARILAPVLHGGEVGVRDLHKVQRRRAWPTVVTQAVQRRMQSAVLSERPASAPLPLVLRMLLEHPRLQRITGRFIGIGVKPEHVGSREGRSV